MTDAERAAASESAREFRFTSHFLSSENISAAQNGSTRRDRVTRVLVILKVRGASRVARNGVRIRAESNPGGCVSLTSSANGAYGDVAKSGAMSIAELTGGDFDSPA